MITSEMVRALLGVAELKAPPEDEMALAVALTEHLEWLRAIPLQDLRDIDLGLVADVRWSNVDVPAED